MGELIFLWWQGILENYVTLTSEWSYSTLHANPSNKDAMKCKQYNPKIPIHMVAWRMWTVRQLYSLWCEFDIKNLLQVFLLFIVN
jgi:hypothetical protein